MRPLFFLAAAGLAMAIPADEDGKALPDGPGKDTVIKVCTDCHGTATLRRVRLSRDDWEDKIADMVDRGAKGSDDELGAVADYLVLNFGKDSKVWMNTAPLGELRAVLGLSVEESRAVVEYRDEHGAFHEWRDLLKIPGLDGKKIEAKKDLMAF